MTLKEKIDLLNLDESEVVKLPKFIASLPYVTYEEMKAIKEFLDSKGIKISKAHELTIFINSLDELNRRFSILDEIHCSDIYIKEPLMLNKNAIEIYKKIKYCIQIGKSYKKEDGNYESFLFSESAWQKVFNKDSDIVNEQNNNEPVTPDVINFTEDITDDLNHIDIKDVINNPEVNEAKTMSFTDLKESVNAMLDALEPIDETVNNLEATRNELLEAKEELMGLDNFKNSIADELNFNDIEFETYESRRVA